MSKTTSSDVLFKGTTSMDSKDPRGPALNLLITALLSVPNIKGTKEEITQNAGLFIDEAWSESNMVSKAFITKIHQKVSEINQVRTRHQQQQQQFQHALQQQLADEGPSNDDIITSILNAKTYYAVLGIEYQKVLTGSYKTKIKAHYKKLAVKIHPDKNKHKKAGEAFKRLNEAMECLINESKKASYDTQYMEAPKKIPQQSRMFGSSKSTFTTDRIFINGVELLPSKPPPGMCCVIEGISFGCWSLGVSHKTYISIPKTPLEVVLDNISINRKLINSRLKVTIDEQKMSDIVKTFNFKQGTYPFSLERKRDGIYHESLRIIECGENDNVVIGQIHVHGDGKSSVVNMFF